MESPDGAAEATERGIGRREAITGAIPLVLSSAAGVAAAAAAVVAVGSEAVAAVSPSAAVSRSGAAPKVPWVRGSTLTIGGRRLTLPSGWIVSAISTAAGTTVLDVSVADTRLAVRVDARTGHPGSGLAGEGLSRLRGAVPPFALSPDGALLAGVAPPATGSGDDPAAADGDPADVPDLVVLDLKTQRVRHRTSPPAPLFPRWFLGPDADEVVVESLDGVPRVWTPSTGALSTLDLPMNRHRTPLAVDRSGTLFLTRDTAGRVSAERRGAAAPEWSSALVADRRAAFSPDARRVAFSGADTVTVLDAADGNPVSRSAALGGAGPWEVSWEDADTVLARDPGAVRDGSPTYRCAVATGAAGRLAVHAVVLSNG